MTVLIAEDNEPVRRMICGFVGKIADRIFECADGADAVRLYGEHRPDWVLMDIEMSGTDGIAAAKQIVDQHSAARVVMVTNFDEIELRQAAAEAGACGYVLKENLFAVGQLLAGEMKQAPIKH